MEDNIKISVRNLVEFVLSCGDLNFSFTGTSRNMDAIRAHQRIQKSQGEEYTKEVPLSIIINKDGFNIEVSGRADGIIKSQDGIIIDEIKTTTSELSSIDEDYNMLIYIQYKMI
jgi:DNA excision repair protein ERCC-2